MSDEPFLSQQAQGSYIAQAAHGGSATVNVVVPAVSLTEKQRRQNRTRMLDRVEAIWIKGVLEPSVQGAAQIALELQNKPSAVLSPLWQVLREFDKTGLLSSAESSIVQVYDQANGEVLILGEPGAGKTTLLLELTRDLLERARRDETSPMPVVFNLSSWALTRQPLAEWLASQLATTYQVPRALATSWVETDQILPLLDGLDEVAATQRDACVVAINTYRREHGLLPTVVCSRQADYLTLSTRLLLRTAVVVQPLTSQQVEFYLESGGERLEALRLALQEDADLQTLATTPLMLNVLAVVYQGKPSGAIIAPGSPKSKREQILASYVQRISARRGISTRYTQTQTIHWLSWLAWQMKRQNQTIFYLEHLQPTWLMGERMRLAYTHWGLRLPAILMGLLVSLLISLGFQHYIKLPGFLLIVTPICILGGFLGWLLCAGGSRYPGDGHSEKTRKGFWPRLRRWLRTGVFLGLLAGLPVGLTYGQLNGLPVGLSFGLSFGLSVGLGGVLLQTTLEEGITTEASLQVPQQARKPKWRLLLKSVPVRNGLLAGLLLGLSTVLSNGLGLGLSFGLLYGLSNGLHEGLGTGLGLGLSFGLIHGLGLGLSAGFLSVLLLGKPVGVSLTDELVWSWGSLRRSLLARKHLTTTLCLMTLIGLFIGLPYGLTFGLRGGLSTVLSDGLSLGLSFWLLLGLFQGVSGETIGDQLRIVPNQGIRRSARNSLVFGLLSTAIVWPILILSDGPSDVLIHGLGLGLSFRLLDLLDAPVRGLSVGLAAGLLAGLLTGGLACLRHSVVRLLLWRSGAMPWNSPRFLDYAAEHILLRKVGGGYIFIHRLLLDYFADRETKPVSAERGVETVAPVDVASSMPPTLTTPDVLADLPTSPISPAPSDRSRLLPCGHEWHSHARFCSVCGASITMPYTPT